MHKVIRDLTTGMFYARGQWTADLFLAEKFFDVGMVEEMVSIRGLKNVEMLFISDDGRVRGGVPVRLGPPTSG